MLMKCPGIEQCVLPHLSLHFVWGKKKEREKEREREREREKDTNELIYETETDLQTKKTSLLLPKWKGGGGGIN